MTNSSFASEEGFHLNNIYSSGDPEISSSSADDIWLAEANDEFQTEGSGAVWIFRIWVGVLACLGLWFLYSLLRHLTKRRREEESEVPAAAIVKEQKEDLPETERRQRLYNIFEQTGTRMEVSKDAIIPSHIDSSHEKVGEELSNQNNITVDEEMGAAGSFLMISPKDQQQQAATSSKPIAVSQVPNCCAICLEDYRVGETVVWSCSANEGSGCPHVYHQECMVDYLVRCRGDGTPCPSCRRDFVKDAESIVEP